MSTRLVLFAHGSRDARWREPFELLRARVAEETSEASVALAYLEFAEPSLGRVADGAVIDGATRLIVLPLFLAPGRHVTRDLEAAVSAIRQRHPELEVETRSTVGEDPRVWSLLAELVAETLGSLRQPGPSSDSPGAKDSLSK